MRLLLCTTFKRSNTAAATTGFLWDTTGMINAFNQGVIITIGDSVMSGTTSRRPWQSGFVPQHPTPIDNAVYEFVYANGVVEVTSEVTGSLQSPDIYPANTQTQYPQWGNDFYTNIGVKPIFLRSAIGGAEFFRNGDDNNWDPSPQGENYDLMMTAWNKCKIDAGVTKPLFIACECGINDAAASQSLLSIRNSIISLISRLQADFGTDVPIRFFGVGASGGVAAYTRLIAVRKFIEDAVRNTFSDFVQFSPKPHDYFAIGYYGSAGAGDDLVHLTQGGNNAFGTDLVNHELYPFFDKNVLNDVYPNFTAVGSSSVRLNFKLRVNFKIQSTATVYWAVYPKAESNHSKADIAAGTGAVAFGTKTTNCNTDEQVTITGLSNNTRYRVQMYGVIGSYETDVFRTITFYTRTSGNAPETNTVLARYSALNATKTSQITNLVEKLLDFDLWTGIDDIYFNGVNNTADKYVVMKGLMNPVNLGTDPNFVANSGLRTTAHTGSDRVNLQVNDFDLPNYLSNDGFYAINYWEDTNQIASGTYRAGFGNVQSTNRCSRFGVTYNSASNKTLTYAISAGNTTIDYSMGTSGIELNKLHIVSKGVTQSTTLDADLVIDGDTRLVSASPVNNVANTADWYLFAQNNNGAISGRSSNGINLLIVGGLSLIDREYLTVAVRELGIGV